MQSASSALIAAIASHDQVLAPPQVRCDWDRDGSFTTAQGNGRPLDVLDADVARVSVSRSLATDLPEGVKAFTGAAVASATVTLATPATSLADPTTQHTSWKYSPFNAGGPLAGKRRVAAPAQVKLGFRGANGAEYLDQLTGVTRRLLVDGPGREATLELLDNVDRDFRRHLTMPMVLADDRTFTGTAQKPGLNATWVVDWVFRQCGYYISPPVRPSCVMSATLHGSGWPEVGTIQDWRGLNYARIPFPPLTPGWPSPAGNFLAGAQLLGNGGEQVDLVMGGAGGADPDNGNTLLMEGWFYPGNISHTNGSPLLNCYRTGVSEPWCTLWVDTNGRVQVSYNRGGGDTTNRATGASGPSGVTAGQWYYIGCYIEWASANTKIWIRLNGTTTGPITIAAGSTTTSPPMNTVSIGRGKGGGFADTELDGLAEAVQVTVENGSGSPPSWNNAFSGSADIMGSVNELVATPPVSGEEAAAVLTQLAKAELGMWGMSESGRPYFRTRYFFGVPPQTTSQETVTTLDKITGLVAEEDVDSVRNKWVVRASPPTVGSPTTDVWSLTDYVSIPASGSRTLWAEFDSPVAYLDTSLTSHGTAGNSRYNASTLKNGSGSVVSNLTFTVTPFAQSAKVVVSNGNAFTVWLVGNSGVSSVAQGVPSVKLVGQPVVFGQGATTPDATDAAPTVSGQNTRVRQEASDATSVSSYGERVFEMPDNPWLQDITAVGTLCAEGLAVTKDPKPVLRGLRVVANPRRQLGDRVTIVDADGLKLSGDWHIAAVTTEQSADGGMTQELEVRAL